MIFFSNRSEWNVEFKFAVQFIKTDTEFWGKTSFFNDTWIHQKIRGRGSKTAQWTLASSPAARRVHLHWLYALNVFPPKLSIGSHYWKSTSCTLKKVEHFEEWRFLVIRDFWAEIVTSCFQLWYQVLQEDSTSPNAQLFSGCMKLILNSCSL